MSEALQAGALAAVVAIVTTLLNRRASPYAALADRVVHLESRVESLEKELAAERVALAAERQKSAAAEAAHQAKVDRLVAHIDKLSALLREHAPKVKIPPLTPPF